MIPIGKISVTVVSVSMTETSKGDPQINVVVKDGDGETGTWYGWFGEKSLAITERALCAFGWDPQLNEYDFAEIDGTQFLVGKRAIADVQDEVDQKGETRRKVKWINAADGQPTHGRLDEAVRNELSARLRARLGPRSSASAPEGLPF